MKKIIILAFVFILSFSTIFVSSASAASVFRDVKETDPYYNELKYLYDKNVLASGSYIDDNVIYPNYNATREIAVASIAKVLNLKPGLIDLKDSLFSDVSWAVEGPYSGYIIEAAKLGIVKGYSNGTFKPGAALTRGHFAIFIDRAFGKYLPNGNVEFSDVPKSNEAYSAVKKLVAAGITTGYSDGTFKPNDNLSNLHLYVFMSRLVEMLEGQNIQVPFNKSSTENDQIDQSKPIDDSKIKLGMSKKEVYELIKSQAYKNSTVDSEVMLTSSGRNGLAGETMYIFSNNRLVNISTDFDLDSLEIKPNTLGELHEYYVNELAIEFGQSYSTYDLLTSWENSEVILHTLKGKNGVTVSLTISSRGI